MTDSAVAATATTTTRTRTTTTAATPSGRSTSWLRSSWQFIAFLLVFLLGGAAFIAITPPGLNPDEPTHVFRAWQVAHGGFVSVESENQPHVRDGEVGGVVPTAWPALFAESHYQRGFEDPTTFRDLDWSKLASLHASADDTGWVTFTNTAQYAPVAYVPQVVAIWVGEALDLPVLVTLELGRALGLLAVAGLLLAAARLTPVGRLAFFAIGMFPSVVSQAASFSADGVTLGLCVLATAVVLRWSLRDGPLGWWRWLLLGVLFVGIALVKPTYAPLAVIVLAIPFRNPAARSWRAIASTAAVAVSAMVALLGWLRATSWISTGVNPLNDPAEQRAYVIGAPFAFVKATLKSLVFDGPTGLTDQKGEIWRGVFGSFSWLRSPLPMVFVILLVVVVVLAILTVEPHERAAVRALRGGVVWRVVVAAGAAAVIGAVCLALYIYYTPTKGLVLEGLQGRYFLPVLPAVVLLFLGGRLVSTRGVRPFVFIACAVAIGAGIATVDLHWYNSFLPYWG